MINLSLNNLPERNPVLLKPVFQKYPAAVNSAIHALEPFFKDTVTIDTIAIRRARRENLAFKQRGAELVCNVSPEKLELCKISVEDLLQKYRKDLELTPKNGIACIVMGIPGSGKTTSLVQLEKEGVIKNGFLEKVFKPNADEIKTKLPGYDPNKGTSELVHTESVNIFREEIFNAIEKRANVLIELSGSYFDYINTFLEKFEKSNYNEIKIVFVDADPTECMRRVVNRFNKTGRFLDPMVIYNQAAAVDTGAQERNYIINPAKNYEFLLNKERLNNSSKFNFYWVDNNDKKPELLSNKSFLKIAEKEVL